MSRIFISYSRDDEAAVSLMRDGLEALGHDVWVDKELTGGQVWWDQILAELRACDLAVFALSPTSLESAACTREYRYAAQVGKPVVPVRLVGHLSTSLLPRELSQIQIVDFSNPNSDAAFRLARAIRQAPPAAALPDPLPAQPEVPVSYLVDLRDKVRGERELDFGEQSALVLELKRSLDDPDTADDGRSLLHSLSQRRELYATVSREIDALLEDRRPARAATVPAPLLGDVGAPTEPEVTTERIGWSATAITAATLAFWSVVVAVGILAWNEASDELDEAVAVGLVGAFGSAIFGAALVRRAGGSVGGMLAAAVTGLVLGGLLWGVAEMVTDTPIVAAAVSAVLSVMIARAYLGTAKR